MAKFQLVSLAAKRKTNQLMSQANAEHWLASGKLADSLLRVAQGLGIAGSIREENTVRLERQHVFRRGLGRNHRYPAALPRQHAENVVFHAKVICHHMQIRLRATAAHPPPDAMDRH